AACRRPLLPLRGAPSGAALLALAQGAGPGIGPLALLAAQSAGAELPIGDGKAEDEGADNDDGGPGSGGDIHVAADAGIGRRGLDALFARQEPARLYEDDDETGEHHGPEGDQAPAQVPG